MTVLSLIRRWSIIEVPFLVPLTQGRLPVLTSSFFDSEFDSVPEAR